MPTPWLTLNSLSSSLFSLAVLKSKVVGGGDAVRVHQNPLCSTR